MMTITGKEEERKRQKEKKQRKNKTKNKNILLFNIIINHCKKLKKSSTTKMVKV